jgi:NAD(P)-dependent dehydrogenase (short-subunit alcohol dehydrogenase family)
MSGTLEGRVVLVTGATGIAAAVVRLAAARGARVVAAALAAGELATLGEQVAGLETVAGDLTEAAAADRAVARAVERFGRLDAVVNVAGLSGRRFGDGPLHACSDEGWERTLAGNLRPVFLVCRAALRQMLAQPQSARGHRGAIVNTSSVLAASPQAQHFATHAYAASKAAIDGLSRSLAAYYAPHGIRVNSLAPGLVRTPMSARAQQDPAILALMETKQPLVRDLIAAEDVARAALFLASDEAAAITGDRLIVDAGWGVS